MKPIKITTKGNNFRTNGKPTGLMLRWLPDIAWMLRTGKKAEVRNLLKRTKEAGFDGISFPVENRDEEIDIYFDSGNLWDYKALRNGHRPTKLLKPMQKNLFNIIELLHEEGLVANVIWDYSMWQDTKIPAGTIGHCFRQLARWFNAVESGEWDPKDEGVPDPKLADQYEHILGKPTNIFVSLHDNVPLKNGLVLKGDIPEHGDSIKTQFARLRKLEEVPKGSGKWYPAQWPGVIAGTTVKGKKKLKFKNMDFVSVKDVPSMPLDFPTYCPWKDVTTINEEDLNYLQKARKNGVAFTLDDDVYRMKDPKSDLEALLVPVDDVPPIDPPDDPPVKPDPNWILVLELILVWLRLQQEEGD